MLRLYNSELSPGAVVLRMLTRKSRLYPETIGFKPSTQNSVLLLLESDGEDCGCAAETGAHTDQRRAA